MCIVDHENFLFCKIPRITKYRDHKNLELYGIYSFLCTLDVSAANYLKLTHTTSGNSY